MARVTVLPNVSISFDGGEADLMFVSEIDHFNFTELPEGVALGRLREGIELPLRALRESGRDITDKCFQVLDQVIYTRPKVMLSMLTKNSQIIRQDCLCYLMERLSPPPEAVWKMPEQAAQ